MGVDLLARPPWAMESLLADSAVRVVVVSGQGAALLGGSRPQGDGRPAHRRRERPERGEARPASPPGKGRRARLERVFRLQGAITAVARLPQAGIAAVHGYCIGGGVDLIAACDIRLASADAVFSVREAKMAIVADPGSLQRLPSIIGAGHLTEFAFTGQGHQRDPGQGDRPARPPGCPCRGRGPRPPGPWPARSPPTLRSPCRAPRRCCVATRGARWPRASSTWPCNA